MVYTASLENAPHIVEKLAAGAGPAADLGHDRSGPVLLGNRPEILARVRHGPTLFGFLASQGVPAPLTLGSRQAASMKDLAAGQRWLRKPVRSGGGHDISFWPDNRPPGAGFVLQQYVPGRPCSAAFVANGRDALLLGICEQLIGRPEFGGGDFAYCGNLYPLSGYEGAAGAGLVGDLTAMVSALTREYGLVGLNGLDFVLSEGQAWPVEVNPRYSASMELVETATGLSMFDWHVRSTLGHELPRADAIADGSRRTGCPAYLRQGDRVCRTRLPGARHDRLGRAGHPRCAVLRRGDRQGQPNMHAVGKRSDRRSLHCKPEGCGGTLERGVVCLR